MNRGVGFLLLAILNVAQPLWGEPAPPLSWKIEKVLTA